MRKLLLALLLLAACSDKGEPRYRLAKVERGPIEVVVVASSSVNAVSSVAVRAPVDGTVILRSGVEVSFSVDALPRRRFSRE